MKTWATDFYDWVLPELPGVPNALVTQHARSVAIHFMSRTGVYEAALAAIPILANTATYTPTPPSGYEIARITFLNHGDKKIHPRSTVQLAGMYLNWQTQEGAPSFYTQETVDTIRVVPKPTTTYDDDLSIRAVLVPSRTASGVEDWIWESWIEVMAAGIKARLMAMPNVPYTNQVMAKQYAGEYRAGCTDALAAVMKSFTQAPLQAPMQRF